jgi:predicted CXXCH cytochrome family protein
MLALTAAVLLVVATTVCLLRLARPAGLARFAVALAMLGAIVPFALATPKAEPEPRPMVGVLRASEYVSSAACKSCHPSEYASWHESYHRTMTQVARASSIAAPLRTPSSFVLDGRAFGLERRGEAVFATLPDGSERRVVLTTGSHHYQAYWMEGREPSMFPFVYLIGDARWVPRREAFVQPPGEDAPVHFGSNCIQCHATAGSPGYDEAEDRLEPVAAELGIACEACHGPGAEHVRKHGDPFERYAAYASGAPDPSIVNPSRLDAARASMVCGACHAFTYPRDEEDFWAHGLTQSFRPGQDLDSARMLLTKETLAHPSSPALSTASENLFYDDGTVRIGGREYNGLVASACFLRGDGKRKLGCFSCHSIHESDPEGQLAEGKSGDGACTPCHDGESYAAQAHTHHPSGSPGSACMGCHMPRTAYALLKSIRSHRIDSPRAFDLGSSDRPNACNLCHLDRTLAWTAVTLKDWYGQPAPAEGGADVSAGASWLLSGDPGQRAIAAAAMAGPGARAAVARGWQAPLLQAALADPYAAVRFIAARSLRGLPDSPRNAGDRALVDRLVAARSTRELTLSE